MSQFLKGKTAIITGGSGTIGKAVAGDLLKNGCNVFITGRNAERLATAKLELEQIKTYTDSSNGNSKPRIDVFQGDVCDEKSVISLFDFVEKLSPNNGCDLLINNAGITAQGTTEEVSVEDFSKVMQVNIVGPFICAREALKRMKPKISSSISSGGRIINIGSLAASKARPDTAPYTTSKFALLGLSQSLALDARPHNIAVGIIHPGNVMSTLLTPEQIKERGEKEGFITAEDVSTCVITMASMPYSANILELTVMPTKQPFVGRG